MSLGRYKFIFLRVEWYVVKVLMLVQILTLFGVYKISLWWLLGLVPLGIAFISVVWAFDKRYVIRGEARTWLENNPDLKEMLEEIKKNTQK